MIYKRYGRVFRKIREQAEVPLSAFLSIGIPKSTLSNFERGNSMMSFDKVILCLELMGSSLEDFEHLLNNYMPCDSTILVEEILHAEIVHDEKELRRLEGIAASYEYPYLEICIKVILKEVIDREVEEVVDFLYKVHLWTVKELYILYVMIDYMTVKDILYILKSLEHQGQGICNSKKYQKYIACVLYRSITSLCMRGEKFKAKELMDRVVKYDFGNTIFLKNLFKAVKGFWIYCFENRKKGQNMIQNFLDKQVLVGDEKMARYYSKRFDYLLSKW
ncbi:Rgg/GadR/MutR family transcriptional regulator [Lactococcus garvieae]|uniref:Rgg/GadR/MutR family transcriptional regulator n=1 Tax=Lactococcus garvieae TaxID=1363 RepID=UPI0038525DCF